MAGPGEHQHTSCWPHQDLLARSQQWCETKPTTASTCCFRVPFRNYQCSSYILHTKKWKGSLWWHLTDTKENKVFVTMPDRRHQATARLTQTLEEPMGMDFSLGLALECSSNWSRWSSRSPPTQTTLWLKWIWETLIFKPVFPFVWNSSGLPPLDKQTQGKHNHEASFSVWEILLRGPPRTAWKQTHLILQVNKEDILEEDGYGQGCHGCLGTDCLTFMLWHAKDHIHMGWGRWVCLA